MGCEQSTPVEAKTTPTPLPEPKTSPSPAEEIVERTTSSPLATELKLGLSSCPVRMQYAYCSRAGPVDQGSTSRFSITKKFAGDAKEAVLALYQGHGEHAVAMADVCRIELPKCFAKHVTRQRMQRYRTSGAPTPHYIPSKWPTLSSAEYETCCRTAFLECNRILHSHPTLDDSESGVSAISVHLYGEHITVCNVGNCRAILGHVVEDSAEEEKEEIGAERNDPLLAIPLSNDHTTKPGTPSSDNADSTPQDTSGYTRSLGDSIAETMGVHSEPEMLTSRLCLNDKVLVIGSSSVFKYLSNKAIIRFCATAENAVVAAHDIVEAAHDQYLYHEKRTDDITAIVCFLECDRNAGPDTTEELVEYAKLSGSTGTATTWDSSGGSSGGSLSTAPPNASSDLQTTWDDSDDVPDVILRL